MSFKKKTLLFVYPKKPGGEYIVSKNLSSKLLQNKSLKIKVIEVSDYRYLILGGKLRLLRIFFSNIGIFIKKLQVISELTKKNIDYFYSPSILICFLALFFTKFKHAKFIYHFNGFDYGENNKTIFQYIRSERQNVLIKYLYLLPFLLFYSWLEKFTIKRISKIIVPTCYSASLIKKRYPFVNQNRVYVVPNAFDEKIYFFKNNSVNNKVFNIIYSGRLVEEKGVKDLIAAFKLLNKKKYYLRIVYPQSEDSSLEKKIKQEVSKIDNISLVKDATPKKIASFYQRSDLAVLPTKTYFEQLPLVYLESLACGTPMLTSFKIPGVLLWQKKIELGLILKSINPRQIASQIEEYVSLSKAKKSRIIERGVKLTKKITWDTTVRLFLNCLLDRK